LIFDKDVTKLKGQKIVFSINDAGTTGLHMQKNEVGVFPYTTKYTVINSKMCHRPNGKG
jgi:hypothetical protein